MSAVETRADTVGCAEQEAARLFEAHSAELLGYCRRHLPSAGDAEDALQTTFLYALRALRRGVEPESETAWLTAIAKNVCFTQLRTLGRRGPVAADVELDRIALAEPEPEETEFLAALPGALAALPENQRNALVMREWLGLGAGEIAERLELTPTATSALLTRARRSLARGLTTAVRPRSALNFGALLDLVRTQLRALLGGAGTKAAVGAVVASVAVGGVAVERSLEPTAPRPARPAAATSPQVRAIGRVSAAGAAPREITAAHGRARRSAGRVAARATLERTAPPATRDAAASTPQRTEPATSPATPAVDQQPSTPPPPGADKAVVPTLPALPPVPVAAPSAPPAIEIPALPVLPVPQVPVNAPEAPPLPSLP